MSAELAAYSLFIPVKIRASRSFNLTKAWLLRKEAEPKRYSGRTSEFQNFESIESLVWAGGPAFLWQTTQWVPHSSRLFAKSLP